MSDVTVGDHVLYVDERGRERDALVTAVHTGMSGEGEPPGLNVVTVTLEEGRTDPYGQQIERLSSVVHEDAQPAHGNFWREAG